MRDDDLDRILSNEDDLSPSSGFTASVMEAARQEASTPAPIPFPWKRAIPGFVAMAVAFAAAFVSALSYLSEPAASPLTYESVRAALAPILELVLRNGVGWALVALVLSLVLVLLSRRLAGARA